MNQAPQPADSELPASADNAIAVVSAYGAFRVLLVLLAVWSFFAGFALFTNGVGALSYGGSSEANRVIGAHMMVLAPVYGLLAWRRSEYRLLIWVPYAAQLAIIVPALWRVFSGHRPHGGLLLIVSIIFLTLFVYVWWSSHPLGHFQHPVGELYDDADEDGDDDEPADRGSAGEARGRRYRRTD